MYTEINVYLSSWTKFLLNNPQPSKLENINRQPSKLDRGIIGLPCGQGQPSRIWKAQCDWLSLGKECCSRLSRVVGRDEIRAPLKTPVWEAKKQSLLSLNLKAKYQFLTCFPYNG